MFTGALIIIAKNWKQLRYTSAGEWIHKLCSGINKSVMEFYSAIPGMAIKAITS